MITINVMWDITVCLLTLYAATAVLCIVCGENISHSKTGVFHKLCCFVGNVSAKATVILGLMLVVMLIALAVAGFDLLVGKL